MQENIFAVYKPKGISSYDVIRKIKHEYPGEKIGHGGTLDPLAEGVLVIGVGRPATKKLQNVLKGSRKVYEAEIELGKMSETDDAEGPITKVDEVDEPSEDEIRDLLHKFEGTVSQTPPRYSAVKINGQPAYKLARQGVGFELEPKQVQINSLELVDYSFPILKIKCDVGSGVYIRSLARDIGKQLSTGAYLRRLIRTRVGDFAVDNAIELHYTF